MTAQIIPFAPAQAPQHAVQAETVFENECQRLRAAFGPPLSAALYALPYVSKEISEHGWPKTLWEPQLPEPGIAGGRFEAASEAACQTVDALVQATRRQADAFLTRLMRDLIEKEARRMAKGGTGSRKLDADAFLFLDRLVAQIANVLTE